MLVVEGIPSAREGQLERRERLGVLPLRVRRGVRVSLRGDVLALEPNHTKGSKIRPPTGQLAGAGGTGRRFDPEVDLIPLDGAAVRPVGARGLTVAVVEAVPAKNKHTSGKRTVVRSVNLKAGSSEERDAWIEALRARADGAAASSEDFDPLFILGKGHFGRVTLARHRHSGALLALKELKEERVNLREVKDKRRREAKLKGAVAKRSLTEMRVEKQVSERLLLAELGDNPFISRLAFAFRESGKLYLATEVATRGDLWTLIREKKRLSLDSARYIVAQVAAAVQSVHKHGIVHRDIKLENIALDAHGQVKLLDFGLSKRLTERPSSTKDKRVYGYTFSLCGTSYYFSPEMVRGLGHNLSNDWWQVGCLLYELLVGKPAFFDKNSQAVQTRILSPEGPDYTVLRKLIGDSKQASLAVEAVQALLIHSSADRLGAQGGAEAVVRHPFFKSMDWDAVKDRLATPPDEILDYINPGDDKDPTVVDQELVARFFRDAKTLDGTSLSDKSLAKRTSAEMARKLVGLGSASAVSHASGVSTPSSPRTEPATPAHLEPPGPFLGYSFKASESLLTELARNAHVESGAR
mmetsp:Transcript_25272/g.71450  ORF Transcript_25272/g.71450 Transcript_25272/m.71450 type:complete len:581 (-) Transcript_25272:225-1967(-)